MNLYDPNYYIEASDDAAMIQSAIDAAALTGEKVVIPRHNLRTGRDIWIIPRALLLHSGTTLILDNCHLRQADGIYDNLFRNANARTERARTLAGRQYDITIHGVGHAVLDGGNHNGLVERNANRDGRPPIIVNTTLHFHNCERVHIDHLSIIHQRWWGMTFHSCANSRVSDIRFMSIGNAPNADGIDLRTGCNGFVIENISGYTQDDSVALTNLGGVFDESMTVKGLDDSIHNVIVRNITTATVCAQVRLLNQDGRKLYNVLIENVQNYCEIDPADERAGEYRLRIPYSGDYYLESSTSWAQPQPYWGTFREGQRPGAGVRIGDNWYYRGGDVKNRAKLGDTYNITVRNVQSRAKFGVTVSCTLCDALIDNVQMYGDGNMPVYFDPGEFDGIRVRDIGYARSARPREEDFALLENPDFTTASRYGFAEMACVYFNRSHVTDLRFDGVRAQAFNSSVFAGYDCDVSLKATDVVRRGEDTALVSGEGIRAEIT